MAEPGKQTGAATSTSVPLLVPLVPAWARAQVFGGVPNELYSILVVSLKDGLRCKLNPAGSLACPQNEPGYWVIRESAVEIARRFRDEFLDWIIENEVDAHFVLCFDAELRGGSF